MLPLGLLLARFVPSSGRPWRKWEPPQLWRRGFRTRATRRRCAGMSPVAAAGGGRSAFTRTATENSGRLRIWRRPRFARNGSAGGARSDPRSAGSRTAPGISSRMRTPGHCTTNATCCCRPRRHPHLVGVGLRSHRRSSRCPCRRGCCRTAPSSPRDRRTPCCSSRSDTCLAERAGGPDAELPTGPSVGFEAWVATVARSLHKATPTIQAARRGLVPATLRGRGLAAFQALAPGWS
mmetsp:Transcript_57962/g.188553  ORF Transcript_57962/g.188553 Transcript_57962/m.188553 type:complete len:236 (-) Transcript_57962:28-735(-)